MSIDKKVALQLIVGIGSLSLYTTALAQTATLEGKVTHVRDGDTIEVESVAVRLNGVAAPELRERHGRASQRFMIDLVGGKPVRCELNGERSYDRVIGVCFIDGQDIGAAVIAAGLARDCPRYSEGRYVGDEVEASRQLPLPGYCLRR